MPTIAVEVGTQAKENSRASRRPSQPQCNKKTARLYAERFNSERLSPPPLIS